MRPEHYLLLSMVACRAAVEGPKDCPSPVTWYEDNDGDGLGAGPEQRGCRAPPGAVATGDDCDDIDPTVLGPTVAYEDRDHDGFGGAQVLI